MNLRPISVPIIDKDVKICGLVDRPDYACLEAKIFSNNGGKLALFDTDRLQVGIQRGSYKRLCWDTQIKFLSPIEISLMRSIIVQVILLKNRVYRVLQLANRKTKEKFNIGRHLKDL